jgi:hypothetical protein
VGTNEHTEKGEPEMSKENEQVQEADDVDQRLQAILGGKGDRIPRVGLESLRRFHKYLVAHLTFPFDGKLSSPIGPHRDTKSPLSVIGLADPVRDYAPEEMHGLICKASQKGEKIELPLDRIDVQESSPHFQLLEDYICWLANCQ